jgi:hypothetical protein
VPVLDRVETQADCGVGKRFVKEAGGQIPLLLKSIETQRVIFADGGGEHVALVVATIFKGGRIVERGRGEAMGEDVANVSRTR